MPFHLNPQQLARVDHLFVMQSLLPVACQKDTQATNSFYPSAVCA
jgi:hypothetical protein